jgi:hypothetical protein
VTDDCDFVRAAVVKKKQKRLTRRHLNATRLHVQRKVLEMHGTEEDERDADRVQNLSVRMNAKQHVRHDNRVKVTFFLVAEEQVRPPNLFRLGQGQEFDSRSIVEF